MVMIYARASEINAIRKLLFLGLSGIILLGGCCREKDKYLIEKQSSFITNYTYKDTLYYVSNLADTDTFIVHNAYTYEDRRGFPCNYVTEWGQVEFYQVDSGSHIDAGSIMAEAQVEYLATLSWLDFEAEPPILSTPNNSVTIGNTTYNNVYITRHDIQTEEDSNVKELYFSIDEGVLKYVLNTGETYEYIAQ